MTDELIGGRGGPSNITVTSSPSSAAQRSRRSTRRTIAAWRSRHQPSGREPMTFMPSTIQGIACGWGSGAAQAFLDAPARVEGALHGAVGARAVGRHQPDRPRELHLVEHDEVRGDRSVADDEVVHPVEHDALAGWRDALKLTLV